MDLILQIVFGIVLLLIVLYIIFYVIYPGSGNSTILTTILSLKTKTELVKANVVQSNLLGTSGCTLMGFFKLNNGNRTTNYKTPYVPIMQVENNWYLEISQTPQGQQHNAARLRINVIDAGKNMDRTIDLPEIPKQKWVFIAILRDGRRFDVLYDNKIVASHRLDVYPVIISSPLVVGNENIDGSVIHVIMNNTRLTPNEVERERLSHIDTNGVVIESNTFDISFPALKLFSQCPPGLPCDPVTKPPKNNLVKWNSPYA